MKIGVFDSGVGGLTVLHDARRQMPQHDYLYYADTDHVPYGEREKGEVQRLVLAAAGWLAERGAGALLVACNTATSVAVEELRRRFAFPVIGMEPAVKPALWRSAGSAAPAGPRGRRVLVAATSLTLQEEKFNRLVEAVDQEGIVDRWPLPELVTYAEREVFDPEMIGACLSRRAAALDRPAYGTLVLGCTHFLYFLPHFRRFFPELDIVDGNQGTVRQLQRQVGTGGAPAGPVFPGGAVSFFESGRPAADPERFERFLARYAGCR